MIVPFFSWKLDKSILLGCGIIPFFSAYSFIKSPISFLMKTEVLKVGESWQSMPSDVQELRGRIDRNLTALHSYSLA